MVILRTPVRYGTLPNTYTDIHTNTLATIISLLLNNCERLVVYANTGSGNLVVTGIGSACCLLFLIIAGSQDFSIAAFQSLRMPLCVWTHIHIYTYTWTRIHKGQFYDRFFVFWLANCTNTHINANSCLFTHSPEQTDHFCL